MNWIKPGYSKLEINHAGKVLVSKTTSVQQKDKALEVLDNWRACHSYPMNVFKIRLKKVAEKIDKKALTVQRLKRVPAILKKLMRPYSGRKPSMKLYQIQDIAGCRAVLANVFLVRELSEKYYLKNDDLRHKLVNKKDYITNPKSDGYRGIHLVYSYLSDKTTEFNSLLIEVQIRSQLQHLWATAVETVDLFTSQAIKSDEGTEEWKEFFKLVSSAFAKLESCPCVPSTPVDEKELYLKIKEKEHQLDVMEKMAGWTSAVDVFRNSKRGAKIKYYLLDLDTHQHRLHVISYKEKETQKAMADYAELEKRYSDRKGHDVVLVGADAQKDLQKAYPNYFADSKAFLLLLDKIINKY